MAKKLNVPPPELPNGPEAPRFTWRDRQKVKLVGVVVDAVTPGIDGYVPVSSIPDLADAVAAHIGAMPVLVREILTHWVTPNGLHMNTLLRDFVDYVPGVTKLLKAGKSAPPMRLIDNQDTDIGYHPVRLLDMRLGSKPGQVEYLARVVWGRLNNHLCYLRSDLAGPRQAMLTHKLGFGQKYLKKTRYKRLTPRDCVGMYTWASISFSQVWKINWGVHNITLSARPVRNDARFLADNRKLMRARQTPCQLGRKLPCCGCPVGLDSCERAVRMLAKPESHPVQLSVEKKCESTHEDAGQGLVHA